MRHIDAEVFLRSQSPVSLLTSDGENLNFVNTGSLTIIVDEHMDLGHKLDFDAQLADSGKSSIEVVAFFREINSVFNLSLMAEECLQFKTLQDLVADIDGNNA